MDDRTKITLATSAIIGAMHWNEIRKWKKENARQAELSLQRTIHNMRAFQEVLEELRVNNKFDQIVKNFE